MAVNNETGVIQDLAAIGNLTKKYGVLLHVDAAQAIGKMAIDVTKAPIDLMSFAAHKVYGPKGMGALYVRKKPRVRVEPLLHGGGHEQGMRSGTLATHQIVGMGEAFQLAYDNFAKDTAHIQNLRDRFLQHLKFIPALKLTTSNPNVVPHILNLQFQNMFADAILRELPTISASTGSACQAQEHDGSYVLRAMGFSIAEAKSAIRFSFGRMTTTEEIDAACAAILKIFKV